MLTFFFKSASLSFMPFLLDFFSSMKSLSLLGGISGAAAGAIDPNSGSTVGAGLARPRDVALSSDTGSVCEPRPGSGPALTSAH